MRVLIDSNVALDHMLQREPFCKSSDKIIDFTSETNEVLISASAVTDVFYIARKHFRDKHKAMTALKKLLQTVKVATVDDADIRRAIALDWADFEDAVQFVASEGAAADCVVTRDKRGYASSTMTVLTPAEFLGYLRT